MTTDNITQEEWLDIVHNIQSFVECTFEEACDIFILM